MSEPRNASLIACNRGVSFLADVEAVEVRVRNSCAEDA